MPCDHVIKRKRYSADVVDLFCHSCNVWLSTEPRLKLAQRKKQGLFVGSPSLADTKQPMTASQAALILEYEWKGKAPANKYDASLLIMRLNKDAARQDRERLAVLNS